MKHVILAALCTATVFFSFGSSAFAGGIEDKYPGYYLDWHDEFDGDSVNTDMWSYEIGDSYSSAYNSPDNVSIENSMLVLSAEKDSSYSGFKYTSGGINTRGKYTYGKGMMEVRAKLAGGKGIWPAIWSCGYADTDTMNQKYPIAWPAMVEIDIMELVGGERDDGSDGDSTIYPCLHWSMPPYGEAKNLNDITNRSYTLESGQKFCDDFHIFGLEWTDTYLIWYLDGKEYFRTQITDSMQGLRDLEQDFRLGLGVGGEWPGEPEETTDFPAKMYVDYVRYYRNPQKDNDEILAEGTEIFGSNELKNALLGSSAGSPFTFSDGSEYSYTEYGYNCNGLQYSMNGGTEFKSPRDASVTVYTKANIKQNDVCVLTFNGQKFYSQDENDALVQFEIADEEYSQLSKVIEIGDTDLGNGEFSKQYAAVFKAEHDYPAGTKFNICLGFNREEAAFIGKMSLVDLKTEYSAEWLTDKFGIAPIRCTKKDILSVGSVLVRNDDFLDLIYRSTEKAPLYFSDGKNTYFYQNSFGACKGMSFKLAGYNGYALPSDAKISVPVSEDIKQGDRCILTCNAQNYWSPENEISVEFALRDSLGTAASETIRAGNTYSGLPDNKFTKQYAVLLVPDRDLKKGSFLDICVGFDNYQSGFVGGITLTNVGTVFSETEIQRAFDILSNISEVKSSENSVEFSAFDDEPKALDYAIAVYDKNKLIDVQLIKDFYTTSDARKNTVNFAQLCEKPRIKIMAFDSISLLAPEFENSGK